MCGEWCVGSGVCGVWCVWGVSVCGEWSEVWCVCVWECEHTVTKYRSTVSVQCYALTFFWWLSVSVHLSDVIKCDIIITK